MDNTEYLNSLRSEELKVFQTLLGARSNILEIGAGSGQQALLLESLGHTVTAIDVESSNYLENRMFPIINYDGVTIPFAENSFDIVFSSNVLEHVSDLDRLFFEIKRVLKPGGICVHVLPRHNWRLWTSAAAFPKALLEIVRSPKLRALLPVLRTAGASALRRHGERGTAFGELWLFHPRWWRRRFEKGGFIVMDDKPCGIFYTANGLLGPSLDIARRKLLSRPLGSATHIFKLAVGK